MEYLPGGDVMVSSTLSAMSCLSASSNMAHLPWYSSLAVDMVVGVEHLLRSCFKSLCKQGA